jgi:hypothetical protein
MRRGLPLLAIAAAIAVVGPSVKSRAAEPVVPDCVGRAGSSVGWSRNGRWLAFSRQVGDEAFALTVVNLKTGRFQTLKMSDRTFGIFWSPVGATLAAASGREVYTWLPAGRLRLIAGGCFGAWSPDAKRIAFATGGWVLTSDPEGRAKKRLLRGDGVESWSSDGRRLAVLRSIALGCPPRSRRLLRLLVYRVDGRSAARVSGDRLPWGSGVAYRGHQRGGTFSPNGRWLAYAEEYRCAPGRMVFDHPQEAYVVGSSTRVGVGWPTWAPSSALILLQGAIWNWPSIVTPLGQFVKRIPGYEVAWSPDSTKVAFTSSGVDLYVAGVRDTEPPKLIASDGQLAAWSPDGSRIAFVRWTTSPYPCRHALHVVSSNGGELRRLVGC